MISRTGPLEARHGIVIIGECRDGLFAGKFTNSSGGRSASPGNLRFNGPQAAGRSNIINIINIIAGIAAAVRVVIFAGNGF